MTAIPAKPFLLTSLALAGAAFSQKGGILPPPQLKISRTIQNDGSLMTLEWNTLPSTTYTVQTSDLRSDWQTIAEDLADPSNTGTIEWTIPDEYVFDYNRFFRVRAVTDGPE